MKQIHMTIDEKVYSEFKSKCLESGANVNKIVEAFMIKVADDPITLKNVINFTNDDEEWYWFAKECEEKGIKPITGLKRLMRGNKEKQRKEEFKQDLDQIYIKDVKKAIKKIIKNGEIATKQAVTKRVHLKNYHGKNLVSRILRDYEGKYWKCEAHIAPVGRPTTKYTML